MIKSLLLLFLSLVILPCSAQLKIVNPSDNTISLSIGHYIDKGLFKGWNTLGWINIAPHDSTTLLPNGIVGNMFYYHGRVIGCDQEYQGQYSLFVHPTDAFKVANAGSDAPLTVNKGITKVLFAKVDLPVGSVQYRFVLPKMNCTQAGKRHGTWTIYLDRDKEETFKPEDASFVRSINYLNGVPSGMVRDYYYPSNKLQWDGKLASSNPDLKQGTCFIYDKTGKKAPRGYLSEWPISWRNKKMGYHRKRNYNP